MGYPKTVAERDSGRWPRADTTGGGSPHPEAGRLRAGVIDFGVARPLDGGGALARPEPASGPLVSRRFFWGAPAFSFGSALLVLGAVTLPV